MLTAIKLWHTMVWAILAGSIVVPRLAGVLRRSRWAAILTGLVLLECGVLAANGGKCPPSDWVCSSIIIGNSHSTEISRLANFVPSVP
jgi:hypothetical protein